MSVILINGFQLKHLMDFIDNDESAEITLENLPEREAHNGEHMPAGLYAWFSDYPEEGVLLLCEDAEEYAKQNAIQEQS